jgi:phosphohistidine phosphatase
MRPWTIFTRLLSRGKGNPHMKTILFLRHGKSDWDADFDHDHERPLNTRGQKAARRMGRFIAESGVVPEHILTSTAVRAQTTLDLAREAGGWDAPVRATRSLYLAGPNDLLREIRSADDAADVLLLVGHQPGWGETVGRLIGGATVRFPTAALARVDVDVARWTEVAFKTGELVWLVPPKALGK